MTDGTIRFEDYQRFAHLLARRVFPRVKARGLPMDYEDVYQEIAVTFCQARDKFDPSRGVKFTDYFGRAAMLNMNRTISGLTNDETIDGNNHISLDWAIEDGSDLHEIIEDVNGQTPEEIVMGGGHRDFVLGRLSPLTRRVCEIVESPSEIVVGQWQAIRVKATLGRSEDQRSRAAPTSVTVAFVMKVMGLSRDDRRTVCKEIEKETGVKLWRV